MPQKVFTHATIVTNMPHATKIGHVPQNLGYMPQKVVAHAPKSYGTCLEKLWHMHQTAMAHALKSCGTCLENIHLFLCNSTYCTCTVWTFHFKNKGLVSKGVGFRGCQNFHHLELLSHYTSTSPAMYAGSLLSHSGHILGSNPMITQNFRHTIVYIDEVWDVTKVLATGF